MLGFFLYRIGRWLAQCSLILRKDGYLSLSEQFSDLAIATHERALLFFEKSSTTIREYRGSAKLRKFLKYAFKNTPFYQELLATRKMNLGEIRSLSDIQKIPILKKEDVRAYHQMLLAKSHPVNHCAPDVTSGSTGIPLRFCLDRCSIPEMKARLFHLWRLVDVKPHELTLLLSSPKFKQLTPKSVIHINPPRIHSDFEQTLLEIRKTRPRVLRGNPLAVLEFSWLIRKSGINDIAFETAILYGHITTPGMRLFIEETLGCKAFSIYTLGEIGGIACECRLQKGHHVVTDSIIVEVVDKHENAVPRGTMGQIIITDLTNYTMPFIRYNTGDLGKFQIGACPCGKSSPLLFIDGREEEMLICPDGKLVFGGSTRDILDKYSDIIERYQIVQEKKEEFIVRIVPAVNFDKKIIDKEISENLATLFGSDSKISIEYVPVIPLEPSGKFKQFISLPWKNRFPSGTFSHNA